MARPFRMRLTRVGPQLSPGPVTTLLTMHPRAKELASGLEPLLPGCLLPKPWVLLRLALAVRPQRERGLLLAGPAQLRQRTQATRQLPGRDEFRPGLEPFSQVLPLASRVL